MYNFEQNKILSKIQWIYKRFNLKINLKIKIHDNYEASKI